MRSRFLALLLVTLLLSSLLALASCGLRQPEPAATAPPPVATAPPSKYKYVESRFDRFSNLTVVTFYPPTLPGRLLTPSLMAIVSRKTPSSPPIAELIKLCFMASNKNWQYLRCDHLSILADGSRVPLPDSKHDGTVEQGFVLEYIRVEISFATLSHLSKSHLIEC